MTKKIPHTINVGVPFHLKGSFGTSNRVAEKHNYPCSAHEANLCRKCSAGCMIPGSRHLGSSMDNQLPIPSLPHATNEKPIGSFLVSQVANRATAAIEWAPSFRDRPQSGQMLKNTAEIVEGDLLRRIMIPFVLFSSLELGKADQWPFHRRL